MQLRMQHRFDFPLERLLLSLSEPTYPGYLSAHHSFFRAIRCLDAKVHAGRLERRVHYEARPPFGRLGPSAMPASWFCWIEHSSFDAQTGILQFENVPTVDFLQGRFENRGAMWFRELPSGGCERVAEFELNLRVEGVYRRLLELAEATIARQVELSLAEESRLLADWVRLEAWSSPSAHEVAEREPRSSPAYARSSPRRP
jgi:hypothetical protein